MNTEAAPSSVYAPAAATGANRQPALESAQQIFTDRVAHLYRQSIPGILLTLFVGAIITVELWTPRYRDLTIMWWLITIAIAAARYALYRSYLQRTDRDEEKWLRWMAIGALAAGVNWGIAGVEHVYSTAKTGFALWHLVGLAELLNSNRGGHKISPVKGDFIIIRTKVLVGISTGTFSARQRQNNMETKTGGVYEENRN